MSLREDQKALAHWIRAPEGVEKALAEDPRPDEARARLDALVRSDERGHAGARLGIYANAYFYRLLGVLSEDYEALRNLLGESLFHDLVTSYLLVEPPRHASLRYAGARMPEFLASHPATEGIRERAPWAADLATLELARVDVFDVEDGPILARDDLASLAPEDFATLELERGPWTELRSFEYPVDELWRRGIQSEPPSTPSATTAATATMHALVWRREERVRHRRIELLEADALRLIEQRVSFGELCEWAAGRVDDVEAPALAASWLENWLADGLLRSRDSLS